MLAVKDNDASQCEDKEYFFFEIPFSAAVYDHTEDEDKQHSKSDEHTVGDTSLIPKGSYDFDNFKENIQTVSDWIKITDSTTEDILYKSYRAKIIDEYLFGVVIGEGSYAKVKECLHVRTLCRHAVKIMKRKRLRRIPHGEAMAAREVEVLKKLPFHPNIIQLYNFYEDFSEKQKMYLFFDLAVCSLQEMMDDWGPFPAWQIHRYFTQLIDGIEFLHSHRIIHNDVKPGNLLLTADETLKICDFGTAEILDIFAFDDTTTRCQGSPAFQAPEVANGADTYHGFKLDVWSAGVSLFTLSLGYLPFSADNIYQLYRVVGRGLFEMPDTIEASLKQLLLGMMNRNSEERFTISDVKRSEWFRKKHPLTLDKVPFSRSAVARFKEFTFYPFLRNLHDFTPPSEVKRDEKEVCLKHSQRHRSLCHVA